MPVKYYQVQIESSLVSKDFEEGALYFCEDTGSIYLDPVGGNKRISVGGASKTDVQKCIDELILGGTF